MSTPAPEASSSADAQGATETPRVEVEGLTMAFGRTVVQRNLSFAVRPGEVFVIMGGSGCGKSTLLKHMIGLIEPARGDVRYNGESFTQARDERRQELQRGFGVLYQQGALWSSLTLGENVALPMEEYTDLARDEIAAQVSFKLALVGLAGFEEYYPAQLSGGMRKRAALARAMALDPEILFFDEPAAGLDPITSQRLDDLILELRDSLGATVIMVTHELASIYATADRAVFLSASRRTMIGLGDPRELREHAEEEEVRAFLNREEPKR